MNPSDVFNNSWMTGELDTSSTPGRRSESAGQSRLKRGLLWGMGSRGVGSLLVGSLLVGSLLALMACTPSPQATERAETPSATGKKPKRAVDPNFFTSASVPAGTGSGAAASAGASNGASTGGAGTGAAGAASTLGSSNTSNAAGGGAATAGARVGTSGAEMKFSSGSVHNDAPVASAPVTAVDGASGGTQVPEYTGFEQKDVPPDFKLKVLANGSGTMTLRSLVGSTNQKGLDAAVVAFTASWCGRCKASYPTLEALQAQYKGRLQIVLLTAEKDEEGKKKMVEVARTEKLTLPLLNAPPELIDLWLGEKQNIPRFYLLDYKGAVRVKDTGFGSKMEKLLPTQVAWLVERRTADAQAPTPH